MLGCGDASVVVGASSDIVEREQSTPVPKVVDCSVEVYQEEPKEEPSAMLCSPTQHYMSTE